MVTIGRMKPKSLLVACCVLFASLPGLAQPAGTGPDQVTGTWLGSMGPDEQDRVPITVELRLDGNRLSGTITGPPFPGEITGGSVDPQTGALKLEVKVKDEANTIVTFEGTMTQGMATGRVRARDLAGTFGITKKGTQTGAASAATGAEPSGAMPTPEQLKASYDAHKGDFDYLLGDWQFTAESKEYGKFRGYWSAVRLEKGQILDEYRIVDEKDETIYVTTTIRAFNAARDRWELVGMDAGNGLQDVGTGQRTADEVRIEQRFGVTSRTPSLWRIRYYNIQPDRFSWTADRSLDNGTTWQQNHQQIEARRIGPARSLGPLTGAKSK
jgi:hypothetical protein